MFQQGEDPIECINKAMAFLFAVASRFPPSKNQLRTSSNPRNQATIQDGRVTVQQVSGRQTQSYAGTGNRGIATISKGNYAAGQIRVVKCYNCQGEGHMARQCTQPKRPRIAAWFKEKLMLAEAQEAAFQTEDLDAYDLDCDDLSLAKAVLMENVSSCDPEVLFEVPYSDSYPNDMINQDVQEMQYSEQTHIDDFQDNEIHSDSNIIPYSQYLQESQDAVIQDTNSSAPNDLLQEIDTLKETLYNHVKEKESLSKTLTVFKTESKEKESKYIDKEIVLEKQNKELENIISLGYQNPFHLKKAQWIKPTLYDGSVIAKEHDVISVFNDEETLMLEEESRSKMLDKQNDPISIEKKIKISPIVYSKLNKIKEDFAPSELPKVILVNESLKKLKYQLANFDNVMKKRTTSDAITVGAWGFEHTKACFVTEIIPFLKVLKETFNAFDRTLLDEITKVQTDFNQMEAAVDQCSIDKTAFEIQIKQLSIDNDQLLKQIMNQLNQEVFQKDYFRENQNAPTFNQLFELNELEAQSQEKDTVIRKLKDRIKSLGGKDSVENVKKDIDEIETINIELEHSVAKLLSENENLRKEREHLKSIYKDQFDSIRKTRVQSKEHCDSSIAQINAKSVENLDLNTQLQEKVFAITALKNELRKLKGKNVVDTAVSKPNATIAPRLFKLDIEPISHKLKNNRDAHEVYIENTIENTNTLRRFIERARTQNPSEPLLESDCMFTKHVHELLVYVSQTCPNLPTPNEKLVAVAPMNKDKRVRFAEPVTTSSNIAKQTGSLKTKDSNKPLLTSTGVKPTTSASGSKPSGNTKNNRITRPSSSNQ
ncbi:retrovirus-related pol polyprotein from transposon TNT 1-94 [Tanacetum coccineum]